MRLLIKGGIYSIDAACVCGVYTRVATNRGQPLFKEMRYTNLTFENRYLVFTLHACVKVKWSVLSVCLSVCCLSSVYLSSVCLSAQKSPDLNIMVVSKCDQIVRSSEKLSSCSRHECYKSCDYIGHTYQLHLAIPCTDLTAHARAQCR